MSDETIFVDGMMVKRRDNAPDFVVCNLSFKVEEIKAFLDQHQRDGWVNADIKVSKGGNLYAALDTWRPSTGEAATAGMAAAKAAAGHVPPAAPMPEGIDGDDVPF